MAKIQNLERVVEILRSKAAAARKDNDVSVTVGFTQNYAIYVHENLEAIHPVGQAKFLEEPARTEAGRIAEIVRTTLSQGKTMAQALVLGGLYLQRCSQKLVPVDTGALKGSAFTRLEK